jgi:D-glycero-D-manno-heptose 1,7-bisphosphate phosphatase
MLDFKLIDKSWTLFLDRDGVLNYEKPEDYIYNYHEFVFYEGAKEAMKIFSSIFNNIILTTNQRGVGKGLMTDEDLDEIHKSMMRDIEAAGGRIDKIYSADSINDEDPLRKPQNGMALLAKKDFPQIDFSKSIMLGNNISDMGFGRNSGMYTVFLRTTHPELELPRPDIDFAYNSLEDFAKALHNS